MKLAMRLPEKARQAADSDPREEATAEIIDLASRTAYPVVAQRKGRSDALGLAVGVGVVALLGAATLWGLNASRMGDDAQVDQSQQAAVPETGPVIAPPVPEQVPNAAVAAPADPAPAPVLAASPAANPAPFGNPYASPTMVFDAGTLPAPTVAMPPVPIDNAPQGAAPDGSAADFASRIGGVGGGTATASSNFDPKTTVTQGTMIPAVLETAINTDVPGYVRAVVSDDVRSFDGTRLLVPRSSRLIGQ